MSSRVSHFMLMLTLCLLAGAVGFASDARAKLTPRMGKALNAPGSFLESGQGTYGVWVRFTDRDLDAAGLARELVAAEIDLDPKAAARRAKMGGGLVTENDLPLNAEYLAAVEAIGAILRQQSRWLNAASFDATPGQIAAIEALPFVEEIDVVARFRKQSVQPTAEEKAALETALALARNDKSLEYSHDYGGSVVGAELINLPRVHDTGLTGKGVTIGVIDTGFILDGHQSMQDMDVVATWDFINGREDVSDHPLNDDPYQSFHGTECLSIIGAYRAGEMVGVAWEASFILAKTEKIDSETRLEEDNWIAALEWMEGLGVDVVSSGLGYYEWYDFSDLDGASAPITLAADMAASRGVTMVVSAGNNFGQGGILPLLAPADGRQVISVGSADPYGHPLTSSSRGPTYDGRIKPDVLGFGYGIQVASWFEDWLYGEKSGSSYANAQVAGVAALMLQKFPHLTPLQVRDALRMTASHSTYPDNAYGWGLVDAYRAVQYHGPEIKHDPIPGTENYTDPLVIEALISSREGASEVDATVTWRADFQEWHRVPMSRVADELFRAEMPAPSAGAVIQYYIEATDATGNMVAHPWDGSETPHLFQAATDNTGPTLDHYYLPDQLHTDWPPRITAVAEDVSGLAGVGVLFRLNEATEIGPFPLLEDGNEYSGFFPMAAGVVKVGDEITYRIVATDGSGRSNTTEAGPFAFRVIDQRARVLLINDTEGLKSLEGERPDIGHGAGPLTGPVTGKSATSIQDWLEESGYVVDTMGSDEVTEGSTNRYGYVVLTSGGNIYPVSYESMRIELIHYVENGGRILIEGGETASMAVDEYPEFAEKVLNISMFLGEGGYSLFQTHGNEGHPMSNRPHRLPFGIDLEVPSGYPVFHASDVVTPGEGAVIHYNAAAAGNAGGILTMDDNTGIDGGQIVYYPFNFDFLKPVMARWLLENAMTWLEIREPAGPSSVWGRVLLADSTDHSGTTVAVDSLHSAVTWLDGSYTIDGLWGGDYTVTATRDGYGSRSLETRVEEGESVPVPDLTLSPITEIELTSNTVIPIPDNDPEGIISELSVVGTGVVQGVWVTVDIHHYSINNLVVKLVSPGGTEVVLHNRSGGSGDHIVGTWPDDLTVDGPGTMDDFHGRGVQGSWQLMVSDHQFGAVGRLDSWTLRIQVSPEEPSGTRDYHRATTRIIGISPNPFNPRTEISFELARTGPVRLAVYDVRGRRVRSLVNGELGPGEHRVTWDGLDDGGRSPSSGLYITRLVADGISEMKKMVLIR